MRSSTESTDRRKELKKALNRSLPFILSHHTSENYSRCYTLRIPGKNLRLCARCTGIYPGILIGFFIYLQSGTASNLLIFLSGMPTLTEKYMTGFKDFEGFNLLRTVTGVLVGAGFIHGVLKIAFEGFKVSTVGIAIFYILAAAWLIYLENPSTLEA